MRNLDQKMNDSKPHIWKLSFNFTIQVCLENLAHFTNLNSTQHYKKYTPATQPKTLLNLQIFQQLCFWLVSEKILALYHLHSTYCILEALGKQLSLYSFISP